MSDGARLGPIVVEAPIGDWPATSNTALDAWEDEVQTDWPRVSSFDEAAGAVRFQASA
ncbi:hypothetical protein MKK63_24600 [Methylobacterium sp. J-088]|uniref:hypothetical protein n=1 Tax=Methylobacterium sp. J-088 TaxID=2836664 RepID=UPI001FB9EE77|nr:hypothetical protein [Methylobacterium sp. J-088]MCJ2065861.1 hypothetical protein [Methylobacterium sp. J-088]